MPLYLFYTMVQKSRKWPKTQIKGGSCLNKGALSRYSVFLCRFFLRSKMAARRPEAAAPANELQA